MMKRFAFALTIAACRATTLFAAGGGPSPTAAGYIYSYVPAALLAKACQYLGFCC